MTTPPPSSKLEPAIGWKIRALPEQAFEAHGVDHFRPGDLGVVTSFFTNSSEDFERFCTHWLRTGQGTSFPRHIWRQGFEFVEALESGMELSIGWRLRALANDDRFDYQVGDMGTISSYCTPPGEDLSQHLCKIVWSRSGSTTSYTKLEWMLAFKSFELVEAQELAIGQQIRVLPGQDFQRDGIWYQPGDIGAVSRLYKRKSDNKWRFEVIWPRTGQTSVHTMALWMEAFEFVQTPAQAPAPACNPGVVRVTALSLSGQTLFGPADLQRQSALQDVRSALEAQKLATVSLVRCGTMEPLRELLPDEDELECTAVFLAQELSHEERAACMAQLQTKSYALEAFSNFSEAARADSLIVLAAVAKDARCLQVASAVMRADRQFILEAVAKQPDCLQYAGADAADRKIVLQAIKTKPTALKHASTELRENQECMLDAVRLHPQCLRFAGAKLKGSKAFMLQAVEVQPSCLQHAPAKHKNDEEVILKAIDLQLNCFLFASDLLKNDQSFVLQVVDKHPNCLQHLGSEWKDNYHVVSLAVENEPSSLRFASHRLQSNKELLKVVRRKTDASSLAVESEPSSLRFASAKKLLEVVMTGVSTEARP